MHIEHQLIDYLNSQDIMFFKRSFNEDNPGTLICFDSLNELGLLRIMICIDEQEKELIIYCIYPNKVAISHINQTIELVCRINSKISLGCFIFDHADRLVSFRYGLKYAEAYSMTQDFLSKYVEELIQIMHQFYECINEVSLRGRDAFQALNMNEPKSDPGLN